MKEHLRVLFTACALVIGLGVGMVGCSTFTSVVGESATDKIKIGAEASLTIIKDGWIPALKAYRSLSKCGKPATPPCWEPDVYAQLWHATDAVTICMQAATRDELTLVGYEACEQKFNAARAAFADLKTKGPTP